MSTPKEDDLNRVQKALDDLGEFFDSVHIFCTRHEPGSEGGTVHVSRGCGNWYARFGQASEWVEKERELSREEIREGRKG